MKKKLLSLICSAAMVTTLFSSFIVAQAADEAALKVITDAEDVTNIKAGDTFNVSVVIDGLEGLTSYNGKKKTGTGISSCEFKLFLPDNDYIESGSETVCSGGVSNWIETDGGYYLSVAFAGAAASMLFTQPATIVTVDVTAKQDITEEQVFSIADGALVEKTVVTSGVVDATSFEKDTLAIQVLTIGGKADEGFKPAAGGNMVNPANGKTEKTYLTDIVKFNTDGTAPTITIKDEAGDTRTFEGDWYPTNLKGQGTINVLVIVRYAGETEKTFSIVNE